ncbi:hypothetical protein HYFRA_00002434 [Hymenoscyphus fraxineus]|uniref:2EXR domain-containing protein n=1 Tax=Hymenoscyphus fraxineus TaxID=746836 RepID=A0A9N9LCE4_9HELO|nr:hypothetical protein HYFRA_00002434 [Hymenoscyphus fraxineus]
MDPPEPASLGRASTLAKPEKTVTISEDMLSELLSASSSVVLRSRERKNSRSNQSYIKIFSKVKEVLDKERQFAYFPLLPPELRRQIWEYYLTDEVVVIKWQSHVGMGGFLQRVGINANTILAQVNREAHSVTLHVHDMQHFQPAMGEHFQLNNSISISLESQIPFFVGVPVQASLYYMLKNHFVPGVCSYHDMFLEGYRGLPILRKSCGIPRIAFEAKDWAKAMSEDTYIRPETQADTAMGILAALQFLEVQEVIIVVHQETTSKEVRFRNPIIDLEDKGFSPKPGVGKFSRWVAMMFKCQPTRPVTWRTLEEMTEERLVDKNNKRVTERDEKLVALNLTPDQFRAQEKYFMWSRCDGWVCPKIRFLEAA